MAGYSGKEHVYYTMQQHVYWPYKANDACSTATGCLLRTLKHQNNKKQRRLRILPPAGCLDFDAICILGHLTNTKGQNKYIVLKADRYINITKANRTAKMTVTMMADSFMKPWVANFGISSKVPTENGPKLTSKLCAVFRKKLSGKMMKST